MKLLRPQMQPTQLSRLPVDDILPDLLRCLREGPNLILQAAPGAGKTTRVPPALLAALPGEIVVLEPRRIAARMAARRVAEELSEPLGQKVGYQVRFESSVGPHTRLRFVTEGILLRRLLADPTLREVSCVVLDEFHERHLDTDLALALLRRLQQTSRPDLSLLVMSATLDAAPVAAFLSAPDGTPCPVLSSEGRLFPVTIEHLPYSPQPLQVRVRLAVEQLLRQAQPGHTLIFLPGAAEIRRARRECQPFAGTHLLLPLHGDLTPAEQDLAVDPDPGTRPRLIFATNVAESSITVEGVTAVIDSGLARVASDFTTAGAAVPTLELRRISQASARQRAGRAGRTAPGRVLRLYPEEDLRLRPEHDTPELLRSDLAPVVLSLRAAGILPGEIRWLDRPPAAALGAAESLLDRLGATTPATAAALARFPLPPRLARLLLEASRRGVANDGILTSAVLSAGFRSAQADLLEVDLLSLLDTLRARPEPTLRREIDQLRRLLPRDASATRPADDAARDEALLQAVLAAFPDRVAERRSGNRLLLASGVSAELAGNPPPAYLFLCALDLEHRVEPGNASGTPAAHAARTDPALPLVRIAARVEPEWLLDLFPDRIREESELLWNREAERVDARSALRYDALTLDETRHARRDPEAAAAMLFDHALQTGLARFVDEDALNELLARLDFAGLEPDSTSHLGTNPGTPCLASETWDSQVTHSLSAPEHILRRLCTGLRSFAELRIAARELPAVLEAEAAQGRLRELAPITLRLPSGRQTRVHYEPGKPPWIASRLQDFFGLTETPRLGPGRVPVVVHLLAPNGRAVQTTTDLAGFWQRLYPEVRRELMRRYPRHQWPEKV